MTTTPFARRWHREALAWGLAALVALAVLLLSMGGQEEAPPASPDQSVASPSGEPAPGVEP